MQAHNEASNPDFGQSPSFPQPPPASTTMPASSISSHTPLSVQQLNHLKLQIIAFKLISRNVAVPPQLQTAIFSPNQAGSLSTQELMSISLPGKIVEASHGHHNAPSHGSHVSSDSSTDNASAQPQTSSTAYNSYTNPLTYLKPVNTYSHSSRQQRMLIPAIMPIGIDPQDIAAERERQLRARIQHRIYEIEKILMDEENDNLSPSERIKKMIELRSLKLWDAQKKLRQEFIRNMSRGTTLATASDRAAFRRMKKQSMRDAKMTDRLEKQQREDRQRRQKQKHLDHLQRICNHGRDMIQWHRTNQTRQLKFGRAVLSYHNQVEKEEQKREERLRKERLRALKNDDEEAYLKLIDKEKDTRIAHLLDQTDSYLESLAQAVVEQQNDDLHLDPAVRGGVELMDENEDEESYTVVNGQKIDYYKVAHRIKEEVEQPTMMEGGTLKDYQARTPSVRKELQQTYIKHIDFQVLLTTYEYIIKDKSILSKIRWVYVIIDEGHRMKNVNSKLSIILTNNYQCRYRLILTGTPLQIFDSVKSFDEWFNTPFANTGGQDKIALNEEESLLIIKRLHKVLRPFLLRRLKKDVESELPDKVERMTAIMSIMEDFLLWRGFKYLRLDGTTKAEDRSILLKKFNSVDSDCFVFLLSTRAGGLGLNLQTADTVIIFDSDWNPHQDLQAQDRAHRIGQTREVRILRLISQKSIEETILARAQYKLDIDGKVIQAGKFDNKSTAEEREAILRLLLEESEEANDVEEEEELDDDELNEILSRNDEELEMFRQMDIERNQREEMDWRRSGGTGKRPERLIEERELPHVYTKEYDAIIRTEDPGVEYGRGQRPRGSVHYDDGLTEEQWVNAIEDQNIDVDELIAKKQAAKKKKIAKKHQKIQAQNQLETSQQSTPHPDELKSDNDSKKKRGRPRKDEMPFFDNAAESSKASKKKGKGKRTADSMDLDDESKKKRKMAKKAPKESPTDTVPPRIRDQMKRIFNELYSSVENLMDDVEGKDWDYYYTIIKKPIAMDIIKRKIKSNSYQTVSQFKDDWHLMFNNARIFNEEGSQVYNDADKMQETFDSKFEELCPGGQLPQLDDDEMEL
ncbi:359_t:CDS:10 [Acaulospora colombiana]|uniref:359_t:CDS:1 n=1 Tax=Acaulospora colombiana TaxID=27376 RepID=A0ACA9KZA5_9GLOM|nr:359_t:CDS:10 [Acaulospora colombiana]